MIDKHENCGGECKTQQLRILYRHDVQYGVSVGFIWLNGILFWDFAFQNPKDNFERFKARKIIEGRIKELSRYHRDMTRDQWEKIRQTVTDVFFVIVSFRRVYDKMGAASTAIPEAVERYINQLDLGGDSSQAKSEGERLSTTEAPRSPIPCYPDTGGHFFRRPGEPCECGKRKAP